jgi:adenylate kinase family enzyme
MNLRISIVGCSGAGKSTLARRLAGTFGIPTLELDAVHHQPNWTPLPEAAFRDRVREFMRIHESWVIDGNYRAVLDEVWSDATHVVWLHPPRWLATWRVGRRSLRRAFGRTRLWNGNRERVRDLFSLDRERSMVVWTWQTHPERARRYARRFEDPTWHRLERRRVTHVSEIDVLLEALQTAIDQPPEIAS